MSNGVYALRKGCPWCAYSDESLRAVHRHMSAEHDFLEGAAPPVNPELTINLGSPISI